jgi:hypothetical protein
MLTIPACDPWKAIEARIAGRIGSQGLLSRFRGGRRDGSLAFALMLRRQLANKTT